MLSPSNTDNRTDTQKLWGFLRQYARHTSDCAITLAIAQDFPNTSKFECTCGFDEQYAGLPNPRVKAGTYQTR